MDFYIFTFYSALKHHIIIYFEKEYSLKFTEAYIMG